MTNWSISEHSIPNEGTNIAKKQFFIITVCHTTTMTRWITLSICSNSTEQPSTANRMLHDEWSFLIYCFILLLKFLLQQEKG
jgi:hypothetical protein